MFCDSYRIHFKNSCLLVLWEQRLLMFSNQTDLPTKLYSHETESNFEDAVLHSHAFSYVTTPKISDVSMSNYRLDYVFSFINSGLFPRVH